MGCPSEVFIGENLTFSICTHDPDTGVLTDTNLGDEPTYRVYEDETTLCINPSTPNADSMSKLDDDNTTGLYTETLVCSVANGYEVGKTYTIYIEATVDGNTGGISYTFKVKIDNSPASIVTALMADTGFTAGGTMTFAEQLQIAAAWNAGNWRTKSGETDVYELLDADDKTTVIIEMTLSQTTPFRTITIKI